MAERATWKDFLMNQLERSPLVSNLFLGLILTLLEKLVEMEFSCPCVSGWNVAFACLFFSIPGFLSFVLMMCIRGCKSIESVCQCCIPTLMWLTLTFLDGQYFACAMTYWSGSYETVPQSAHRKWCKPDNTSNEPPEELLRMTQLWFTVSQFIGMVFVGILTLALGVYATIQKCFRDNNKDQGPEETPAAVEMDPLN